MGVKDGNWLNCVEDVWSWRRSLLGFWYNGFTTNWGWCLGSTLSGDLWCLWCLGVEVFSFSGRGREKCVNNEEVSNVMCPEVSGSNVCSAPSPEIIVIFSTWTVLSILLNVSKVSLVPPSVLAGSNSSIPLIWDCTARVQMTPSMYRLSSIGGSLMCRQPWSVQAP